MDFKTYTQRGKIISDTSLTMCVILGSELSTIASFIYDVVQSVSAGHVHQNSSAHVVRRGHLDAAAVLAHGSPQRPIGLCSR